MPLAQPLAGYNLLGPLAQALAGKTLCWLRKLADYFQMCGNDVALCGCIDIEVHVNLLRMEASSARVEVFF